MKKQYKTVIHTYFSDYVSRLLGISLLFIVTSVVCIIFNELNKFFWIIPLSFIIIYLLSMPLLILYCKVKKDLKANNIDKIIIREFEIKNDKNFNFKNRGGTTVGKNKYKIVDENGDGYLVSALNDKDWFMGFYPDPTFYLEIEVLKISRLVLQMKIIENSKTKKESREQQHNIRHFKNIFNHYF